MKRNLIIIAVLLGSLVLCSCTNSAQVNSNISSGSSTDENSSIAESYTVTENGIYDRAKLSEFEYTPLAEFDTDFLKESGCDQIGDCYKRAQSLALWLG